MKQIMCFLMMVMLSSFAFGQSFDTYFTVGTMRVDYYHTGTKGHEEMALDKVYKEGEWPGSKTQLLDPLNLGEYFVKVIDVKTNTVIYSRGFCCVFDEWQTTDDAINGVTKTFHETVRFPFPKNKVLVSLSRRDKFVAAGETMAFREIFSTVIDPNDPTVVNTEKRTNAFNVFDVMINGPSEKKVDILILGDGYSKKDIEKYRADVKHFTETLFSYQPFKKHKKDFNVRAMEVISEESGIDIPDKNIWKNTALGTMYNTFGSARYVLTEDNRALRDIADAAPYDFITILVNDNRYGGGGIFNLYTTCFTNAVQPGQDWEHDYVYVHEFGHCFGGLADEYYTSQTSYNDMYPKGIEPWEPNITRAASFDKLKWKNLVTPGISIPTPWHKEEYDSIETLRGKLDRLANDYYAKRESLLKRSQEIIKDTAIAGKVGAFEGAGYLSTGMYRPSVDCKMFALNPVDYDPVCAAAIERMIELFIK
ncbi:MAG TPA: M64 family metallopeptidase [Bacteroidota bacterium]|nr:M64 family metallopeptidase [Bacteroidota bacterium]